MLFKHRDPLNIFGCFFLFLLDCPLCKKLPHPEDPDHLQKIKLSYQTILFATGRPICDDGDDGDDDEDDDRDDDDHGDIYIMMKCVSVCHKKLESPVTTCNHP